MHKAFEQREDTVVCDALSTLGGVMGDALAESGEIGVCDVFDRLRVWNKGFVGVFVCDGL